MIFYLRLSSGKNIEDSKNEMFTNTTDSTIKKAIDTWYSQNMTSYTEKLEDTIWCNDRTLYKGSLFGKDEDVGTSASYFSADNRMKTKYSPSVNCPNESRDGFTISMNSGGNGKLTYPVGLLTADEIMLAGGSSNNTSYYLYTGQTYWSLSPSRFDLNFAYDFFVNSGGTLYRGHVSDSNGVRPAVSLVPGTRTVAGDGTVYDPYVIED